MPSSGCIALLGLLPERWRPTRARALGFITKGQAREQQVEEMPRTRCGEDAAMHLHTPPRALHLHALRPRQALWVLLHTLMKSSAIGD